MPNTGGVRRPRLLALVSVASLALMVTTLAGVLLVVDQHLRTAALNATTADDHALVGGFLRRTLTADDLSIGTDASRAETVTAKLEAFVDEHALLGATIHDAAGEARYAAGSLAPGDRLAPAPQRAALAGQPSVAVDEARTVLVEHLPVAGSDGALRATVSIERDAAPILAAASVAIRDVSLVLVAGAVVLAGILLLVFRAAQQLLDRRTQQLIESARRDGLTDLPNHGSVVAELNAVLEAARPESGWVIVAAIDIDGFRLLNETHGYDAGDRALRMLAEVVAREAPPGAIVGRAGPDELLMIGPPTAAPEIRGAVDRVRASLAGSPLAIEGAEPLALTVSVGIASYPEHAASGSELLAVVGLMLAEARVGGGDRVRVDAPDRAMTPGAWSGFSVLEGLVLAVDAKDHYTRRHSEQVSSYAVMLADRMGMDAHEREQVRVVGILHDVGKIGVPDMILRKPAALTADERAVMERHAVLGHAIVAGLPGFEDVARGIRHHHERWDGSGYPDRLGGTAIPLIARVISLADVYSALTTARPYRRAFSAEDAVRHIADAAGSQFDPTLVVTFLDLVRELPGWQLPLDDHDAALPIALDSGTEAA